MVILYQKNIIIRINSNFCLKSFYHQIFIFKLIQQNGDKMFYQNQFYDKFKFQLIFFSQPTILYDRTNFFKNQKNYRKLKRFIVRIFCFKF